MCDRIKLRSDFYFNPKNNYVSGIVVDNDSKKIDLATEVLKIFKEDNKDCNNHKNKHSQDILCSIYVNQFRFRDVNNRTSVGEFFFDNDSASGDEIMRQIKQVIVGFELAGAKIVGLHMDGGGENIRGVKLLRLGNDPCNNMAWLTEDTCSFRNPFDPSRRVAIVLC